MTAEPVKHNLTYSAVHASSLGDDFSTGAWYNWIMQPTLEKRHIEVTPRVCGGRARIAWHRIRVQDVVLWTEQGQDRPRRSGRGRDSLAS